jgi:hypothetical protein
MPSSTPECSSASKSRKRKLPTDSDTLCSAEGTTFNKGSDDKHTTLPRCSSRAAARSNSYSTCSTDNRGKKSLHQDTSELCPLSNSEESLRRGDLKGAHGVLAMYVTAVDITLQRLKPYGVTLDTTAIHDLRKNANMLIEKSKSLVLVGDTIEETDPLVVALASQGLTTMRYLSSFKAVKAGNKSVSSSTKSLSTSWFSTRSPQISVKPGKNSGVDPFPAAKPRDRQTTSTKSTVSVNSAAHNKSLVKMKTRFDSVDVFLRAFETLPIDTTSEFPACGLLNPKAASSSSSIPLSPVCLSNMFVRLANFWHSGEASLSSVPFSFPRKGQSNTKETRRRVEWPSERKTRLSTSLQLPVATEGISDVPVSQQKDTNECNTDEKQLLVDGGESATCITCASDHPVGMLLKLCKTCVNSLMCECCFDQWVREKRGDTQARTLFGSGSCHIERKTNILPAYPTDSTSMRCPTCRGDVDTRGVSQQPCTETRVSWACQHCDVQIPVHAHDLTTARDKWRQHLLVCNKLSIRCQLGGCRVMCSPTSTGSTPQNKKHNISLIPWVFHASGDDCRSYRCRSKLCSSSGHHPLKYMTRREYIQHDRAHQLVGFLLTLVVTSARVVVQSTRSVVNKNELSEMDTLSFIALLESLSSLENIVHVAQKEWGAQEWHLDALKLVPNNHTESQSGKISPSHDIQGMRVPVVDIDRFMWHKIDTRTTSALERVMADNVSSDDDVPPFPSDSLRHLLQHRLFQIPRNRTPIADHLPVAVNRNRVAAMNVVEMIERVRAVIRGAPLEQWGVPTNNSLDYSNS